MKTLHLYYADGEKRTVTEDGRITRHGRTPWVGSDKWIFLGVSFSLLRRGIDLPLARIFADPAQLIRKDAKGRTMPLVGWDNDHGTVRQNVSPRIMQAWVTVEGTTNIHPNEGGN